MTNSGTGKTVISALDYRRFASVNPSRANRLLFIAHREEILRQSLMTFRGVLRDMNFGELWAGSFRPENPAHVFISVQTLNSQRLWELLEPDYYDYIVVDETHHAAADSYEKALSYFTPRILLGLTATPERLDGRSILGFFDDRIAAEIRLPEAIERKLLCPFQYFGVSDTADLTELRWVRGGYDRSELSNLYTLSRGIADRRADYIIAQLDRYTADMDKLKALGFCVSREHARFMAERFNKAGIASLALDSGSSDEERFNARKRLIKGEIKVIFAVDLYNEGVDIPEVNTVLFLRPTESLTIFLQQLGRGLRLSDGKDCLTVLDFIGAANRRYNFERKFAALLANSGTSVESEIKRGFPGVPRGCYIQLEKKARDVILGNIRAGYGSRRGVIAQIETFYDEKGRAPSLAEFISRSGMSARDIYRLDSFSQLCAEAGARAEFDEPAKTAVTDALRRLALMDSPRWIRFLTGVLPRPDRIEADRLDANGKLMLSMFHATVWGRAADDFSSQEFREHMKDLAQSPVMLSEILELLQLRYDSIDVADSGNTLPYLCPLDMHCTYTRDQLLCALGFNAFSSMREGVKFLKDRQTDVLLITLNKSEKDYSPTTMYNDYAPNSTMFHWQSQSTTSAESATGQRYIHHRETGGSILLFVREYKKDAWGTCAYTFLGEAEYVSHEGSKPMNILWKLKEPIPAKYLRKIQLVI